MAKHVIFLGAGASYTSGYPLAADLRVILSSPERFRAYLDGKIEKITGLDVFKQSELKDKLVKAFDVYNEAIKLFRDGGFATVDEFSYLARERHETFVQTLKRFTAVIFAVHNPEHWYPKPGTQINETTTAFQSSDYFPFIQKLFNETLHEFRDELAVLSYNYDPYLEFLLERAYKVRKQTSGKKYDKTPTRILSGFGDFDDESLLNEKGFCFLKLHGTSVLPRFDSHRGSINERDPITFGEVFEPNDNLGRKLSAQAHSGSLDRPPIFFPWELIKDNGKFVSKDKFREVEGSLAQSDTRLGNDGSYYEVFKAIWQRAQREITDAEKISFVGLSMHEFLKPGLRYLFDERVRKYSSSQTTQDSTSEIILACPGAWSQGDDFRKAPIPNSPTEKLIKMLREVNSNMAAPDGGILTKGSHKSGAGRVVSYQDFASFIKAEM